MTGSFFDPEGGPKTERFNFEVQWWNQYQDFHILPAISLDDTMGDNTDIYFEWLRASARLTINKK